MLDKPIIILGGMGMLGQDLAYVFKDFTPLVWDRENLDITNKEAIEVKFNELKPKIVINAAAYNFVDKAEEDDAYQVALKVNADGPKNIAEVCASIDATFLHYSTDYVFAGDQQEGYQEDDRPSPQSRYAESKLKGEQNVLAVHGKNYVVRTCRLFGNAGAGAGSKQSFVDLMISLAAKKDQLDVVNEEVACPTYSLDLARQTRVLLEGEFTPGIYHMTNQGACTWFEFASEIFKQENIDIKVNAVGADAFPRPAARPAYSALNNTKLPSMRSWQEALAEYLSIRKSS